MGEVFEVAHPTLPRHEAVKLLSSALSTDPSFKTRFLREADVMAGLLHPNIVTVFDRGEDADGRMWLAMELVNGTDAAQLLASRGPMPPELVIDVISGAGAALDFAWRSRRVTHRDVKPANILVAVAASDRAETVKLADFGIAKASEGATELTATGLTVGTLTYMSPEALEGHALDGFADQYSLGCTAFALLTGQSPFAADSKAAIMTGHLSKPVPAVTRSRPDLPLALDDVFRRVLAKHPGDRYGSCEEFVDALRSVSPMGRSNAPELTRVAGRAGVPTQIREGTTFSRNPRQPAQVQLTAPSRPSGVRRKALIGVSAACVLSVAAAATAYLVTRPRYEPITDLALLTPTAETVGKSILTGTDTKNTSVVAENPVTNMSGIGYPAVFADPVKCSWFATGALPDPKSYRSTRYTPPAGSRGMTVQIQLLRFDSDAGKVIDISLNPADQCQSVKVTPGNSTTAVPTLAGTWSIRPVGETRAERTVVASYDGTTTDPNFYARAVRSEGSLTVAATSWNTGGGIGDQDPQHLAKLIQSVLDRAAGRTK